MGDPYHTQTKASSVFICEHEAQCEGFLPRHPRREPQGFCNTTLPFFQMQIGVPCIRAISRAALAERRKPRPTALANSAVSGFTVLRFMVLFLKYNLDSVAGGFPPLQTIMNESAM